MAEPHSTAAAAVGSGAAVLVGTVIGVSYDVMFWSIVGALAGMKFGQPSDSWLKAVGNVASSAVIGAMIAPIGSVWAVSVLPALGKEFQGHALHPWVAGLSAAFGPKLIPMAIDAVGLLWTRLAGGNGTGPR